VQGFGVVDCAAEVCRFEVEHFLLSPVLRLSAVPD
jgi:hypothetical protein